MTEMFKLTLYLSFTSFETTGLMQTKSNFLRHLSTNTTWVHPRTFK